MKINVNTEDYKYLLEIHAHTAPASGCGKLKPEELIKGYSERGYHGIAITNHFFPNGNIDVAERLLDDYHEALECADKYNIKIYLDIEVRFNAQSNNDYLVFGIDEDFVKEVTLAYPKSLEEFYKRFKNDKNLVIQAHPKRNGMIDMPTEYLDGIETFNLHYNHNSRVAVAARYARDNEILITTGGTDVHESPFGLCGTRFKKMPKDSFELAEMIKSRDFILDVAGSIIIPHRFFSKE